MAREPERMEWFRNGEIQTSVSQIEQIVGTGVFQAPILRPLFMSAVTQVLIMLNDLLMKANLEDRRINFADDVIPMDGIADVTDLISKMRNASCHIPSGLRDFNGGRLAFNVISGLMPRAIVIGETVIGCDYAMWQLIMAECDYT